MKFAFKNLGPITQADLELGDLTIISGRNNTGKTYMAYALYGFMKKFSDVLLSDSVSVFFDKCFQDAVSLSANDVANYINFREHIEWKVDASTLVEQQAQLIREISREFSKNELHNIFAAPQSLFEGVSFGSNFEQDLSVGVSTIMNLVGGQDLYLGYDGGNVIMKLINFGFESEGDGEDEGEVVDQGEEEDDPIEWLVITEEDINRVYSYLLLRGIFTSHFIPSILSSARHTIPLFISELDYTRSQFVRVWMQETREGEKIALPVRRELKKNVSDYALPIHDNIDFFRRVPYRAERSGNNPPGNFSADVERIAGGRFSSTDGELRFTASDINKPSFDIPLFLASSSAWEMSSFYFLLGYFLDDGRSHFLIIDEPESHLDTANQIQLTRLLARLVNSGTKVLITTHSDYIIREFNNLIMLTSPLEDGEEIKMSLGYKKDDELRQDQVKAYVAQAGTLKECRKNKYGIEMPVFDETIDGLNDRAEELASQILIKESEE